MSRERKSPAANRFAGFRYWAIAAVALTMSGAAAPPKASSDVPHATAKLGPVSVDAQIKPAKPMIGDPVTLTITVTAEPGVELLMPEFGEALDRFSILDFVPRKKLDGRGRTVETQQYRLQPSNSGPQSIPPILIEFIDHRPNQKAAPEGSDAYEILTDRIDFEVQSVLPKDAKADLKPPLGKLDKLAAPKRPRWPWLIALAAAILAACPFVWSRYRAWRAMARRRSAYDVARSRLDSLLARRTPSAEQIGPFYVELSGIVRRYLEDRFDVRAPELTTEEFLASAQHSADLTRDHQGLLREFLRQADLVKFAGLRPTEEDIRASIQAAERFLEETRENAPLINAPMETTAVETPQTAEARHD